MSIDAIEPFPGQELTDAMRGAVTVEERLSLGLLTRRKSVCC